MNEQGIGVEDEKEKVVIPENIKKFNIRSLTDDDLFTVMELFTLCTQKAQDQILQLTQGKGNASELGIKLFMTIFIALTGPEKDKVRGFFASLIGSDLATYKKMPFTTTVDLIKELKDCEDVKKLLATVSGIFSTKKK